MTGKEIRLDRIRDRRSKNFLIVPMDHGITIGPVKGLEQLKSTVDSVAEGGADAVLMHKGMVEKGHRGGGKDIGLIVHLNASTSLGSEPNRKVKVTNVKEAVRLGADAVSFHINVGSNSESEQMRELGGVAEECEEFGIPLLAMTYVRGENVDTTSENIAHAARLGAELGADVVKTSYTGEPNKFRQVVEGCPAPVVIAGGPKTDSEREFLTNIQEAIGTGARGVAIGRNIFQHQNVTRMVEAISLIVHEDKSVDEAMKALEGSMETSHT